MQNFQHPPNDLGSGFHQDRRTAFAAKLRHTPCDGLRDGYIAINRQNRLRHDRA